MVVGEGLSHDVGHGFLADGDLADREGGGEAPVAEFEQHGGEEADPHIDTDPEGGAEVVIPGLGDGVELEGVCFKERGGFSEHCDEILEGDDKAIDCEL